MSRLAVLLMATLGLTIVPYNAFAKTKFFGHTFELSFFNFKIYFDYCSYYFLPSALPGFILLESPFPLFFFLSSMFYLLLPNNHNSLIFLVETFNVIVYPQSQLNYMFLIS